MIYLFPGFKEVFFFSNTQELPLNLLSFSVPFKLEVSKVFPLVYFFIMPSPPSSPELVLVLLFLYCSHHDLSVSAFFPCSFFPIFLPQSSQFHPPSALLIHLTCVVLTQHLKQHQRTLNVLTQKVGNIQISFIAHQDAVLGFSSENVFTSNEACAVSVLEQRLEDLSSSPRPSYNIHGQPQTINISVSCYSV